MYAMTTQGRRRLLPRFSPPPSCRINNNALFRRQHTKGGSSSVGCCPPVRPLVAIGVCCHSHPSHGNNSAAPRLDRQRKGEREKGAPVSLSAQRRRRHLALFQISNFLAAAAAAGGKTVLRRKGRKRVSLLHMCVPSLFSEKLAPRTLYRASLLAVVVGFFWVDFWGDNGCLCACLSFSSLTLHPGERVVVKRKCVDGARWWQNGGKGTSTPLSLHLN